MDTKNIIERIIESTERLTDHYWQRVEQGDHKAASGVESCCELNLKLLGLITKPDIILGGEATANASTDQVVLDVSRLSDDALGEIQALITEQQQNQN